MDRTWKLFLIRNRKWEKLDGTALKIPPSDGVSISFEVDPMPSRLQSNL